MQVKPTPPCHPVTHTYDPSRCPCSFSHCGSRRNRGWPGHRHPETATPETRRREHTETQTPPQLARHTAPEVALHTRERRKRNLPQSPHLAPIHPFYLSDCPVYDHHPTVTKPSSRIQTVLVPNFRTPRSPGTLTRHPRDYGLRPFRPARAVKATPAYPDSKAAPGPTSFRRPPWPITPRKAAPAYLQSNGHRCPSSPSASLSSPHASPTSAHTAVNNQLIRSRKRKTKSVHIDYRAH